MMFVQRLFLVWWSAAYLFLVEAPLLIAFPIPFGLICSGEPVIPKEAFLFGGGGLLLLTDF